MSLGGAWGQGLTGCRGAPWTPQPSVLMVSGHLWLSQAVLVATALTTALVTFPTVRRTGEIGWPPFAVHYSSSLTLPQGVQPPRFMARKVPLRDVASFCLGGTRWAGIGR